MTNSLSKARKRFFARDPDVGRYAAADTAYDDGEYVPEYTEDERADAERRKVSLISIFVTLQPHALPGPPSPSTHSFIPSRQWSPLLTHAHSVTSPLAFRREMQPFCTL